MNLTSEQLAAVNEIFEGAREVVRGGIDGIQTIAATEPQLIIDVISGLAEIVDLFAKDKLDQL